MSFMELCYVGKCSDRAIWVEMKGGDNDPYPVGSEVVRIERNISLYFCFLIKENI